MLLLRSIDKNKLGVALFIVGMFAAIYHPVGLAIVTAKWRNTGMRIAVK